jgi:hypothetical protein
MGQSPSNKALEASDKTSRPEKSKGVIPFLSHQTSKRENMANRTIRKLVDVLDEIKDKDMKASMIEVFMMASLGEIQKEKEDALERLREMIADE